MLYFYLAYWSSVWGLFSKRIVSELPTVRITLGSYHALAFFQAIPFSERCSSYSYGSVTTMHFIMVPFDSLYQNYLLEFWHLTHFFLEVTLRLPCKHLSIDTYCMYCLLFNRKHRVTVGSTESLLLSSIVRFPKWRYRSAVWWRIPTADCTVSTARSEVHGRSLSFCFLVILDRLCQIVVACLVKWKSSVSECKTVRVNAIKDPGC